ncbi:hypothetical protein [Sorangium sp. So ce542]|uniref:hypothetical protein n=1 Tax=Sorangium sp. So ce542 TaxID=3133316 RepID=UPI003F643BD4
MKLHSLPPLFAVALALFGCASTQPELDPAEAADEGSAPAAGSSTDDSAFEPEPAFPEAPDQLLRRADEIASDAAADCAAGAADGDIARLSSPVSNVAGTGAAACSWCEKAWTCVLSGGRVRYSGYYETIDNVVYCRGFRGDCCN